MDLFNGLNFGIALLGSFFGGIAAWYGKRAWDNTKANERPQISSLQYACNCDRIYFRVHVQPGNVFEKVIAIRIPGIKLAIAVPKHNAATAADVEQRSPFKDEVHIDVDLEPGMGHKSIYFILKAAPKQAFRIQLQSCNHGTVCFKVGQDVVDRIAEDFELQRQNEEVLARDTKKETVGAPSQDIWRYL